MTDSPRTDTAQVGLPAQAAIRPDAPALVFEDVTVTFADLDDRARRVGVVLADRGVQAGDRVAVMIHNSPEWFEAVHGVGRIGAVAVPVNTHFRADEVAHVIADSGATVLIVDADLAGETRDIAVAHTLVVGDGYDKALASAGPGDPLVADGWPTTMLYTSGTTGLPKGVAMGENDIRRRAEGFAMMGSAWGIGPHDTHLAPGPLYHAGPAAWVHMHLAVGGTSVVLRRFDAELCLRLIETHGVTTTNMVPTHFVRMLALPDQVRDRYDLSSLRLVMHGAAPCPVPVKEAMLDWWGEDKIFEFYGASEGGGSVITPQEWRQRPGSVGKAHPGYEFRVTDEEGRPLEPNETGTIWVRSQVSSFEYHNDPEKTAASYDGDWFTVGDVGHLDGEGYLFITDRRSDMVISGGVNIYPREIEDVLFRHPGVVDCAVLGVPDDEWGESLLAVVQTRDGDLDEAGVQAWCEDHLAGYKRPRHVVLVDELPRDPNGKVVKRKLRSQWEGQSGSQTEGSQLAPSE